MKIAIAQMNTVAADFDVTVERMLEYARQAKGQGAELVCYPFAALTGDEPMPEADQEGFLIDATNAVSALTDELPLPALVPVVASYGGEPMAEVMLIRDHRVTPVRLVSYLGGLAGGADDDSTSDDADADPSPIAQLELGGCKVALAFDDDDLDELRAYDYDANVILYFNSYPFALNDPSSAMGCGLSNSRYGDDADQTGAWIVGVNGVGGYSDEVFVGSSFVLAPWGEMAAQAPALEEALVVAAVDPADEGPLAHPLALEVYDPGLVGWGALSLALRDLVAKSDHTDLAVLLEGTLQSALVAALAVDSVGPVRVHMVLAKPQDQGLLEAMRSTAKALRVADVREVDLSAGEDEATRADLAQVRLAALAREHDAIALGSTDKTSLALDDRTHGVYAASIEPLGDVYRSDVLWLARMRNTISPVIAPELMKAYACPKVDGIRFCGPTDEVRLEFVDNVLESYIDFGRSVSDVSAHSGNSLIVMDLLRRVRDRELSRAMGGGTPIVLSRMSIPDDPAPMVTPWRDHPRSSEELSEVEQLESMGMGGDADVATADGDEASREKVAHDIAAFLHDYLGGVYGNPGEDGGKKDDGQQGGWMPFSEN